MSRTDYYRAVLLGVILGMSFLVLFHMVGVATDVKDSEPKVIAPASNFEVVDKYKGCDLLRWTDNQVATYKYVLYCPSK